MVLRLTKQKAIYKNLVKMVVFDIDWQPYQLRKLPDQNKVAKKRKDVGNYYFYVITGSPS